MSAGAGPLNPPTQYVSSSLEIQLTPQCLKNIEIVSLNIASEASYVYILRGQKFNKNANYGHFFSIFRNFMDFMDFPPFLDFFFHFWNFLPIHIKVPFY